jgi:uncharacterized protein
MRGFDGAVGFARRPTPSTWAYKDLADQKLRGYGIDYFDGIEQQDRSEPSNTAGSDCSRVAARCQATVVLARTSSRCASIEAPFATAERPEGATAVNSPLFDPATEKYVSLATYRRNGIEVKTPVWIAKMAGRYYVFSAGEAGKVKRIRATPRVRLAACDVRGNVRSAWIEARARIVSDQALIVEIRKALRGKYGLVMRLTDVTAAMTGRIRRRAYIEIELVGSS